MDLFRVRSKVSGFFLKVPGGELGWRVQELIEQIPVTRPGWWLLEPSETSREPTVVAYEDRRGLWWEYMPATGKLHNLPWLSTLFHYQDLDATGYRRTRLTSVEAKRLVAQGAGRASDDPLVTAHANDLTARDPRTALP